MKKLLLPLLLLLVGVGSGVGAGLLLSPAVEVPEEMAAETCPEPLVTTESPPARSLPDPEAPPNEFAKMGNQFIVPVVQDGEIKSMVVLSISLEVPEGETQRAFSAEPKIRDQFLQDLFDHANTGGFEGNFTNANTMRVLRESLLHSATQILGSGVIDVLINDIARQDV